eukprot:1064233_1
MSLFLEPEAAKRFECVICFEIYKEPVQIGCEDHVFCNPCIKELMSEQGDSFHCPLCRKKCRANKVARVRFIDRQIADLRVQCPNAIKYQNHTNNTRSIRRSKRLKQKRNQENNVRSGQKRRRSYDAETHNNNKKRKLNDDDELYRCEWKGCYSELTKHNTTCPLQVVICQFCNLSMLQRKLKEHHDVECPRFPMQCIQCKDTGILRKKMASHIARVCPMTMICCTECKEEVQRKNKKAHKKNECPESLIECVFRSFGCMEKLTRKDEKKHTLNAAFTHQHLMQVAKHQNKLADTVKALKRDNTRLTARIIALEQKQVVNAMSIDENQRRMDGLPQHFDNAKLVYVSDASGQLATYDRKKNKCNYSSNYSKPFH